MHKWRPSKGKVPPGAYIVLVLVATQHGEEVLFHDAFNMMQALVPSRLLCYHSAYPDVVAGVASMLQAFGNSKDVSGRGNGMNWLRRAALLERRKKDTRGLEASIKWSHV